MFPQKNIDYKIEEENKSEVNSIYNFPTKHNDDKSKVFSSIFKLEEDNMFIGELEFEDGFIKDLKFFYNEIDKIRDNNNKLYIDDIHDTTRIKSTILSTKQSSFEDIVTEGFNIYTKLKNTSLGFIVLGKDYIDKDDVSTEDYPILDKSLLSNFKILYDFKNPEKHEKSYFNKFSKSSGSVLFSNVWCVYINDCFLLGIIDNRLSSYLASKRDLSTITSNPVYYCETIVMPFDKNGRLTIFARELIGILCAGYSITKHPSLGEVLSPPKKYISMSLFEYVKAVKYFEESGDWKHLYNPNLSAIEFDFNKNTIKRVIFI